MEPPCGATVLPFYARAAGFAVPPARPAIRGLDYPPLRGRLVDDFPSDFKEARGGKTSPAVARIIEQIRTRRPAVTPKLAPPAARNSVVLRKGHRRLILA